MLKAYEYRIYPTPIQEEIFNQTLGLCRLYWNIVVDNKNKDLSFKIEGYKPIFEKYKPEALEWIKEASCSIPLAQMWSDVRGAYGNFFKSCKGERKGKFVEPPKKKSKKNPKDSFRYSCSNCEPKIDKNGLYLTKKLGYIDIRANCRFCEGKWKNITFRRTKTGKWFVKICVEKKDEKKNKNGKVIAIDWNCRSDSFLTMNDGTKVKCPEFFAESERQLNHQMRALSRKMYQPFFEKYGRMPDLTNIQDKIKFKELLSNTSKNLEKQRLKVAKLQEHISWQRKDWLHKLSREICNQYETVVVEDINLQNMASDLGHGRAVSEQGFGMFRQMIAYKGNLVKVNPKNTSKTCHICGFINPQVKEGVFEWDCPICHNHHDRDINASINILRKYIEKYNVVGWELTEDNACGGVHSTPMKQENELTSTYRL